MSSTQVLGLLPGAAWLVRELYSANDEVSFALYLPDSAVLRWFRHVASHFLEGGKGNWGAKNTFWGAEIKLWGEASYVTMHVGKCIK